MKEEDLDPELVAKIRKVTGKRPRTVIDHILEHGKITTEEIRDVYGYNHPPRAIRDVREAGIPLEMTWVTGSDGRRMGAYTFGDLDSIEDYKLGGRKVFSKDFSRGLFGSFDYRCAMCNEQYEDRYLQVDHRIPYEVAGETGRIGNESEPDLFMPVCGTCNRKKSWSCEHCTNWTGEKDAEICKRCYWASPEDFTHIALRPVRRVEIVWSEKEVTEFDKIASAARKKGVAIQEYMKFLLHR